MSARVLQINMKFNASSEDLQKGFAQVAGDIAAVSGLRWKVWIINEETNEAGGLYLFEDRDSVEAYLQGPLIAGLKENPALSEPSFKQFDVLDELTAVTRGPV